MLAADLGNHELNMIVTGGHLEQPDDFVLLASGEECWLTGKRVETTSTHGTGCAFSSALTSRLILGDAGIDAVANAKSYVTEALRTAYPVGQGGGPINHLFEVRQAADVCRVKESSDEPTG
jgi:hydroxymethylpyrimidine/phosphomethylpyrimidine kinase